MRFVARLDSVVPYEPGTPIEVVQRRFGLERVVKLASNEFPLPPFPAVERAIIDAIGELNRYPDGGATTLRQALAAHYGVPADCVAVGNGSCELLMLLGEALLEPGDEVVFADPSFVVYRDICLVRGAQAVSVPLVDYRHDLEAMARAVTPRTKMLIVCNPNNPTGTYVSAAELAGLVERVPDEVLVVFDEAYNEFVTADDAQGSLALQREHDNVCVLRTFSKIYGLCGLRVGYGLCAEPVRQAIDKVRQPFNVSTLAQVAATEALKHQDEVAARRRTNAELRRYLVESLAERGRATVPSQANFVLVDVSDLECGGMVVSEALMRLGVIVRNGTALGCPGWIRVSVGSREEIDMFLEALARLEAGAAGRS